MNKTNIEWVKNPDGTQGYTWNPITGCLNGCEYCYARKLANGRLKPLYLANQNIAPIGTMIVGAAMGEKALKDPFYPRFWPERLQELVPIGGLVCELVYPPKTRKGIFVCDMGELFGDWLPYEWQEAVFRLIKKWPAHRFYLLTKQPQNLIKFSPFLDNCWVGVTVTSNSAMTLAMTNLVNVDAPVRFISFEPLLGMIGMSDHMSMESEIDWVIIGAQTKPYKPPKIEWVEEIVKSADRAGIPVFLKDNLHKAVPQNNHLFRKLNPMNGQYLELRQEMPGLH